MIQKRAVIEWIPKEQGGRTKPPLGVANPFYSTLVRFVDKPWPPSESAWDLVVIKDPSQSTEYIWIATVRFLVEEAPHDSLRDGREFELYEGPKCVARGRVLAE